jgi:myo-inositol-1(or 4)-monophosphatase
LTDWLALCRAAGEDVRARGGPPTTAVDAAAEDAVVERLSGSGEAFTLVSEELGEKRFGEGGPWIVIDPIDGSNNAKRGIPHFALSIAVADGSTMGDVLVGYVLDLGSGEEWTARRGEGAFLNGAALGRERPKEQMEILAFEATTTRSVAEQAASMVGIAYRLRIMGSLALALCQLAAGRLDGVCSLKPARSVDIAAAQLLVRECGLAVELFEAPPFDDAPLDVEGRSRVVAAATPAGCARLAAALSSSQ